MDYTSVCFIPDSNDVLSCGNDKTVSYWNDTKKPIEILKTIGNGLKIAISPNKQHIAVGDELGYLYIIDGVTLDLIEKLNAHNGLIRDLCFSADSKQLVTGGGDSLVSV